VHRDRDLSAGKLTVVFLFLGIAVGLLLLKGCEMAKRRRIESQIESLTRTREDLLQTLANQRQHLEELTQQLNNQNSELEEFKADVQSYMFSHPLAIGALYVGVKAAGVALDENNVFDLNTKDAAHWITAAAALWALANAGEMIDVVTTLNQDNAAVHTRMTAIAGTESTIQQQKITIAATQARVEKITHQLAELQKELEK
jgi:septal ring factor EnvC (AmiA/AmiB activator)